MRMRQRVDEMDTLCELCHKLPFRYKCPKCEKKSCRCDTVEAPNVKITSTNLF